MNDSRDPNLIIDSRPDEGPTDLPDRPAGRSRRRSGRSTRSGASGSRGCGPHARRSGRCARGGARLALAGVYLFGRFGSSESVGPPIATSSPEPIASATDLGSPPPLVGRIAFTRYDSEFGPFGDNVGMFTMNADGTDERQPRPPVRFRWDRLVARRVADPAAERPTARDSPSARPSRTPTDRTTGSSRSKAPPPTCGAAAWSPDGDACCAASRTKTIPPWTAFTRSQPTAPTCDGSRPTPPSAFRVPTASAVVATCRATSRRTALSSCSSARYADRHPILPTRRPRPSMSARSARKQTDEITIPGFVHPHLGAPHWSPDGEWILFGGISGLIYKVRPDGTDARPSRSRRASLDAYLYSPDWSPDGARIVFTMGSCGRFGRRRAVLGCGRWLGPATDHPPPGHRGPVELGAARSLIPPVPAHYAWRVPDPKRPTRAPSRPRRSPAAPSAWDRQATWYDGWVGGKGSRYHQAIVLPVALELLDPREGEEILDVGAGQGVLAPAVVRSGARYTGVDASPRLIDAARRRHGRTGRFVVGDARRLSAVKELRPGRL